MLKTVFSIVLLAAAQQQQQGDAGHTIFIIGMTLLGAAVLTGFVVLFVDMIKWGIRGIFTVLRGILSGVYSNVKVSLKEPIEGFTYDKAQDIFFSDLNAWQRELGYCRLYDESAALMSMIIDCEPVYFDCGGKHWLIEFWKGQYSVATGCEVGIYTTTRPELKIPGIFYGTFFDAARPGDMLNLSYVLYKDGKALFKRSGRHWWLTGFAVGLFSDPSELTAKISIVLKDKTMLAAFTGAMKKIGYKDSDLTIRGNSVAFTYGKPHEAQPFTRTREMELFVQKKNKHLCERFNKLAGNEKDAVAKLEAVRTLDHSIYSNIIDFGGSKVILDKYKMLEKFMPKAKQGDNNG